MAETTQAQKDAYFNVFKNIIETQDDDDLGDAKVIDVTPGTITLQGERAVVTPMKGKLSIIKDITELVTTTTGANAHFQLKQMLDGVPDGPWVAEGRDNSLTIHNRNFNQKPILTYIFRGGNHELLSFSAKTTRKNKTVDAIGSTDVNEEEKTVEQVNTQISTPQTASDSTVVNNPELKFGYPNDVFPYKGAPYNLKGDYMPYRTYTPEETKKILIKAKTKESIIKTETDNFNPLEQDITSYVNDKLKPKYQELTQKAKEGNIEPLLSANQLPDFTIKRKVWVAKSVNPSDYWEEYMRSRGVSDKDLKNLGTNYYNRWKAGYKYLSSKPGVRVFPPKSGNQYGPNAAAGKVRIAQFEEIEVPIDGARVLSYASGANATVAANRLEEQIQHEIEGTAKVVGNPLLRCGKVILVKGKLSEKYVGNWYIKSVTHYVNSSGYTCSINMVRKSIVSTVTSVSSSVNTKSVYADISKLAKERVALDEAGVNQESVVNLAIEKTKQRLSENTILGQDPKSFTVITKDYPNSVKVVVANKDTINIQESDLIQQATYKKIKK